jgi:hypothetical protein
MQEKANAEKTRSQNYWNRNIFELDEGQEGETATLD